MTLTDVVTDKATELRVASVDPGVILSPLERIREKHGLSLKVDTVLVDGVALPVQSVLGRCVVVVDGNGAKSLVAFSQATVNESDVSWVTREPSANSRARSRGQAHARRSRRFTEPV